MFANTGIFFKPNGEPDESLNKAFMFPTRGEALDWYIEKYGDSNLMFQIGKNIDDFIMSLERAKKLYE